MCGPARLLWVIWASYVVLTATCLLALLVGAPYYLNNICQADFVFFTFFLHNISLPEFSRINANTHNTYKKRLAGYYPPAENEDNVNCCRLLPRRYYLVLLTNKNAKYNGHDKSPYCTIHSPTKSEKYNIPHASNIGGGLSKFFWANFGIKKESHRK